MGCEDFLMSLPCSIERLFQAKRFCLSRQYARCLDFVSSNFSDLPVETLAKEPAILVDLISKLKQAQKELKQAQEKEKARSGANPEAHWARLMRLPHEMQGKL